MGSAKVKIMNLTAQKKTGEGRPDTYYPIQPIGAEMSLCRAASSMHICHSRQADNTDVIIISIRDPLTGDVYVYRHVVNPY